MQTSGCCHGLEHAAGGCELLQVTAEQVGFLACKRYGVSLLHDRQRELQGATKLAEGRNEGRSGTTGNHKALGKWKQQGPHARAAGASCHSRPKQPHCKGVTHKT